MSNTFGTLFRLTTYGESHGPGLGGVVDGCPAGLPLNEATIQAELNARKPGEAGCGGPGGTERNEADKVQILSGVYDGKTTGTPIAFHVGNTDQRSYDYTELASLLRPGHADLGFLCKYGIRDPRGSGRASGRETLCRVAGGAIAQVLLARAGIQVRACTLELGGITAPLSDPAGAGTRAFFAPDSTVIPLWEEAVLAAKAAGDSLGGLVRIEAFGVPAGLGEPVFDKLDARLAYAMMGVGAVKGVEIGQGFAAARMRGSENNDPFLPLPAPQGSVATTGTLPGGSGYAFASNNAGGIIGGISSGAPLVITVAVKPISSLGRTQRTITIEGNPVDVAIKGRHDCSAIPRIVPVLKAMAALTLADFLLLQRNSQ